MARTRKRRKRRGSRPPQQQQQRPKPKPAGAEPPRRRTARDQRPPAPWGSFPLSELVVLVALVMLVAGFFVQDFQGTVMIGIGIALASLAGLELSIREHFAGYRSHTLLIAGTAGVMTVAVCFFAAGLILAVCLAVGAVVFAAVFVALRGAFRRASGGLSFRVGGLRG